MAMSYEETRDRILNDAFDMNLCWGITHKLYETRCASPLDPVRVANAKALMSATPSIQMTTLSEVRTMILLLTCKDCHRSKSKYIRLHNLANIWLSDATSSPAKIDWIRDPSILKNRRRSTGDLRTPRSTPPPMPRSAASDSTIARSVHSPTPASRRPSVQRPLLCQAESRAVDRTGDVLLAQREAGIQAVTPVPQTYRLRPSSASSLRHDPSSDGAETSSLGSRSLPSDELADVSISNTERHTDLQEQATYDPFTSESGPRPGMHSPPTQRASSPMHIPGAFEACTPGSTPEPALPQRATATSAFIPGRHVDRSARASADDVTNCISDGAVKRGTIYAFLLCHDGGEGDEARLGHVKIGQTKGKVRTRWRGIQTTTKCQLERDTYIEKGQIDLGQLDRIEELIHKDLSHVQHPLSYTIDGTDHEQREWFKISLADAREVIEFWIHAVQTIEARGGGLVLPPGYESTAEFQGKERLSHAQRLAIWRRYLRLEQPLKQEFLASPVSHELSLLTAGAVFGISALVLVLTFVINNFIDNMLRSVAAMLG